MPEQVKGQDPEVVPASRHADHRPPEPDRLRPLPDLLPALAVQRRETGVEIHAALSRFRPQRAGGGLVPVGTDAQVDVAGRPQTRLRIQPADRPALTSSA
jgi:hypothetical protein